MKTSLVETLYNRVTVLILGLLSLVSAFYIRHLPEVSEPHT
jgi:hypothetical protein